MNIKKIKINLRERSYDIHIGSDLLKHFDFGIYNASKYVVLTDSNVKKLFGSQLARRLTNQKLSVELVEIPAGENSKNLGVVENIGRKLARRGINKQAIIIALGGGVVGDIAGFVASVYERGIRYIQVPTTLLAQVDSSIGGKTGVNIPEGKNLIGAIHQPVAVITDVQTLKHLPDSEIKNGLAEVIKYAVIKDGKLFRYLEDHIQERNSEFYLTIIQRSAEIKTSVVSKDETENEFRKILNYGHTIAHAIEILTNHRIPHGEAVAYGMMREGKISQLLGLFDIAALERQNNLIRKLNFRSDFYFKPKALIEIMKHDKKSLQNKLYFVLPDKIGRIQQKNDRVAMAVDEKIVTDCFNDLPYPLKNFGSRKK